MKKFLLVLMFLFLGATPAEPTVKAGWSYSGQVRFRIKQEANMIVYHNPEKAFSYDGELVKEDIVFEKNVDAGKYLLTVEGYYHLELR